ncbi:DUF4838 domain-containing protein [Paenibacillus baekrokdamisoli]|uniref:DUF4838 domain-containing protein n=1 Tax=Paenibacillus baekrokdamisoli TaxID=1712516 RepID=A0A3G9IZH4_9BACL|nr:DUF4838 domain-containing protein [Paenibacillus baekrokdamisoli]MBB3071136.1 hypothetical protein [Paenibacillus baekrokdamisoli]BBH21555.1 DUF4838 domain-containing protein [Paenibacillus baekrokdamisoli]
MGAVRDMKPEGDMYNKAQKMNGIYVISRGYEPLSFAAEELRKYLIALSGREIVLHHSDRYYEEQPGIWVGLRTDFPEVPQTEWPGQGTEEDDAVWIDVECGQGILAGSNPRSVLLSVYRYLTEVGCRWVRPGQDGEYIPQIDYLTKVVKLMEAASYRYRGICIEGAVSLENVTDMIDWMPKMGFNGYFIQFREAYVFFERWYNHLSNPLKQSDDKLEVASALFNVEAAVAEIKRRGLEYHAVGHGWTSTAFGIPALGWGKVEWEADPDITPYLAQINGKRELWQGVPMDTELCYSNAEARSRMIGEIIRYTADHPEIDMLHVWLSDGHNNQCECENCVRASPSDWYVLMMNELDEALTARDMGIRIVFLLYQELLWAPLHERFRNSDRFVLMFAPITRTYRKSFAEAGNSPSIPPFERNKIDFPLSIEENVSYLEDWQHVFSGDGFDFDYHFMWAHQKDPGQVSITRILHEDIKHLHQIGLRGYMSCQVQRSFFPNGLGLTVMGRTLWNRNLSFEQITGDYFISAYGKDGLNCRNYMTTLSQLYDNLDLEKAADRDQVDKSVFESIYTLIRQFEPIIERNLLIPNRCHAVSWSYVNHHKDIWFMMTQALELLYGGEASEARTQWQAVRNRLWEIEELVQPVLDIYNSVLVFDGVFAR